MAARERASRVADMAKGGMSDDEIAKALGVKREWARELRRRGGVTHESHNTTAPEVREKIAELSESGWPPSEIADTLGVSVQVASRWSTNKGAWLEWNSVARWASAKHSALFESIRARRAPREV